MGTVTRNQNRRTLLTPISLAVSAQVAVTALVASGTTATASTGTTPTVGQWVLLSGSDHPRLTGPFQVVSVSAGVSFTVTIDASLTYTSATTNLKWQLVQASAIWGDGTTVDGLVSVGALPTALGGEFIGRITNGTTAPTIVPNMAVFTSDSGGPGTWRLHRIVGGSPNASDIATLRVAITRGKFALAIFYGNTGTAVIVSGEGEEDTSNTY